MFICDASEKENILHACHSRSDPTSGHLSIKKTIKRIREQFTWKGLNKQVIELVGVTNQYKYCVYTCNPLEYVLFVFLGVIL